MIPTDAIARLDALTPRPRRRAKRLTTASVAAPLRPSRPTAPTKHLHHVGLLAESVGGS